MKVTFKTLTLAVMLLAASFAYAEDLRPITGSTTSTTLSITNSVKDQYIIAAHVWGTFSGTNDVSMKINYPETSTPSFLFAKSSTATNSLTYLDGTGALLWIAIRRTSTVAPIAFLSQPIFGFF